MYLPNKISSKIDIKKVNDLSNMDLPFLSPFTNIFLFDNSKNFNAFKASFGSVCISAWVQPKTSPFAISKPFKIPFP